MTEAALHYYKAGAVPPSAWPDASNTGPSGTLTTNSSASITVTNGQVIQNQNFTGVAIVVPAGVTGWTIRNCRITIAGFYGVDNGGVGIIEDCEFIGTGSVAACITDGGGGSSGNLNQILRCNVRGSQDGIKAGQWSVIEDCYIHGLTFVAPDSHNDGIQFQDYNHITVRHCWIDTPDTSCIIMGGGESRPAANTILVENCHFQGGAYCLYGPFGASVTSPPSQNVSVINNHWSTALFANGGLNGPNTQWEDGLSNSNVWSGNVWDDGPNAGLAVSPGYG